MIFVVFLGFGSRLIYDRSFNHLSNPDHVVFLSTPCIVLNRRMGGRCGLGFDTNGPSSRIFGWNWNPAFADVGRTMVNYCANTANEPPRVRSLLLPA